MKTAVNQKYSILLTTTAREGHSYYNGSYGGGWAWDTATPTSTHLSFDSEDDAETAITELETESNESLEYTIVRLWKKKAKQRKCQSY